MVAVRDGNQHRERAIIVLRRRLDVRAPGRRKLADKWGEPHAQETEVVTLDHFT